MQEKRAKVRMELQRSAEEVELGGAGWALWASEEQCSKNFKIGKLQILMPHSFLQMDSQDISFPNFGQQIVPKVLKKGPTGWGWLS